MDTLLVKIDTIATKINAVALQLSPCTEKAETNCQDVYIVLIICLTIGLTVYFCVRVITNYFASMNAAKVQAKNDQYDLEIKKKEFEEVELVKKKKELDFDCFANEMYMKEKKLEFDKKQTDEDIRKKRLENACEIEKKKAECECEIEKKKAECEY